MVTHLEPDILKCEVKGALGNIKNNRVGKTIDLFKKIGDIKGIFQARMGTVKVRNSKDLTKAGEIKKWQKYTEELS